MKTSMLRFAVPAFCLITAQLPSQVIAATAPTPPAYTQSLMYVKVAPGKSNEYLQLLRDHTMKLQQVRADAGEIVSWTLLRSVFPAGEEARANYLISTITEGPPKSMNSSRTAGEERAKKAGVTMTWNEYTAKRNSLTTLVASELWRIRERVAAPAKGHYVMLNSMKVHDAAAYNDFESNVWRPLAAERVKRGQMSGWIFATKLMPGGTETPYTAYSADMYPTYEAAFKSWSSQEVFAAAHPGKNYDQTMVGFNKLRDLAKREMWTVVERVEKSKK